MSAKRTRTDPADLDPTASEGPKSPAASEPGADAIATPLDLTAFLQMLDNDKELRTRIIAHLKDTDPQQALVDGGRFMAFDALYPIIDTLVKETSCYSTSEKMIEAVDIIRRAKIPFPAQLRRKLFEELFVDFYHGRTVKGNCVKKPPADVASYVENGRKWYRYLASNSDSLEFVAKGALNLGLAPAAVVKTMGMLVIDFSDPSMHSIPVQVPEHTSPSGTPLEPNGPVRGEAGEELE